MPGTQGHAQDYTLELVVDTAGTGGVFSVIEPYVSLNDRGTTAFSGTDAFGSQVFVSSKPGFSAPASFFGSNRIFTGAAINNDALPQVASRDRVSGSPPSFFVRKWPSDNSQAWTMVGQSTATPKYLDSALPFLDISDSGLVVFSALTNGSTKAALFAGTSAPPTKLLEYLDTATLHPQVSSNHVIAFRDDANRIALYQYPAGPLLTLADSTVGFASVGSEPGIAANGTAVGFIGTQAGVEALHLSVVAGATWSTYSLLKVGEDGFTDLAQDQRVGAATTGSLGQAGGLDATVAFVGTRNGSLGLYTRSLQLASSGSGIAGLGQGGTRTVVRVGSVVGGKTVASLRSHDPFNRNGQLAVQAGFSTGASGVIRASCKATPALTVRLSVKRVLGTNGVSNPDWATPVLQQSIQDVSQFMSDQAGISLQLEEIVDIVDPGLPLQADGTPTSWFNTNLALASQMEQAAESDPCAYAWRPDAINLYLIDTRIDATGQPVGGATFLPDGPQNANDIVFLTPGAVGWKLTHELGHYFGLEHTFNTADGVEGPSACVAPAANCQQTGDRVCDTFYDPNDLTQLFALYGCTSCFGCDTGNADHPYHALRYNVMSYYPGLHPGNSLFTPGQVCRMLDNLNTFRRHVLVGEPVPQLTSVSPNEESYPGAEHFVVSGQNLPTSGDVRLTAGGKVSLQAQNPTSTLIAFDFAGELAPGWHCVGVTQDGRLRANLAAGIKTKPALDISVDSSGGGTLKLVSSVPNALMVLAFGTPSVTPTPIPGILNPLWLDPSQPLPFFSLGSGPTAQVQIPFALWSLPSGILIGAQAVEVGSPQVTFSNWAAVLP